MTAVDSKRCPFVGPRPLTAEDKIHGRDDEIRSLFYRLAAERVVWLHSPSGAGKSSLIWAGNGLRNRLEDDGFAVWKARVNLPSAGLGNRYTQSVVSSLEFDSGTKVEPSSELRLALDSDRPEALSQTVAELRARVGANKVVLVFDQFEEVLTAAAADIARKRDFFRALGSALEDPHVWALFALREDYLAPMSPYVSYIPTGWQHTFRLDLLTVERGPAGGLSGTAVDAITETADDGGGKFEPEALEKLVDELAKVRVQAPGSEPVEEDGTRVEPVLLQVACQRIWRSAENTDSIGLADVETRTGSRVDDALGEFYREQVEEIAKGDFEQERSLREFFSKKLILPSGVRGTVVCGEAETGGLANEIVDDLNTRHLIRAERRAGAVWYELAHDRLVEPVGAQNQAWLERELHPMQIQAEVWEESGKEGRFLLRGLDLPRAQAFRRASPTRVRPIERLLLRKSWKRWGVGLGVGLAVLLVAGVLFRLFWIGERANRVAAQANRIVVDLLEAVDPDNARGSDTTVREVLDQSGSVLGESEVDSAVKARYETTVGRIYRLVGRPELAVPFLQQAVEYHRVQEKKTGFHWLLDWLKGSGPDALAHAEALNELGSALYYQGNRGEEDARECSYEVVDGEREWAGPPYAFVHRWCEAYEIRREELRDPKEDDPLITDSLNNLALAIADPKSQEELTAEKLEEGRDLMDAVIDRSERARKRPDLSGPDLKRVAIRYDNRGGVRRQLGELVAAEVVYWLEELIYGEPVEKEKLVGLAAKFEKASERFGEAIEDHREALRILAQLEGTEGSDPCTLSPGQPPGNPPEAGHDRAAPSPATATACLHLGLARAKRFESFDAALEHLECLVRAEFRDEHGCRDAAQPPGDVLPLLEKLYSDLESQLGEQSSGLGQLEAAVEMRRSLYADGVDLVVDARRERALAAWREARRSERVASVIEEPATRSRALEQAKSAQQAAICSLNEIGDGEDLRDEYETSWGQEAPDCVSEEQTPSSESAQGP